MQVKRTNQLCQEKTHQKDVKGSKLTYLVGFEVAVQHICILIILVGTDADLSMK